MADIIELEEKLNQLRLQVTELKKTMNRKQHSRQTAACLEDAISVALGIILEEEAAREVVIQRLRDLVKILQEGRESPYSYDIERPSGRKLTVEEFTHGINNAEKD
ncbi:MAG: hypothetical protein EOM66_09515 [Clostridia bacterium]|nr:hypothetical protein [Clostridia bacterium]